MDFSCSPGMGDELSRQAPAIPSPGPAPHGDATAGGPPLKARPWTPRRPGPHTLYSAPTGLRLAHGTRRHPTVTGGTANLAPSRCRYVWRLFTAPPVPCPGRLRGRGGRGWGWLHGFGRLPGGGLLARAGPWWGGGLRSE